MNTPATGICKAGTYIILGWRGGKMKTVLIIIEIIETFVDLTEKLYLCFGS